jgi:hypothetical protein
MKRFLLYLASGLLAAIVGYLINQVPNLPDDWKPWVPGTIAGLIVVSAIVLIRQDAGGSSPSDLEQGQDSAPVQQNIRDQGKGYQIKANRIDRIGDDYGK